MKIKDLQAQIDWISETAYPTVSGDEFVEVAEIAMSMLKLEEMQETFYVDIWRRDGHSSVSLERGYENVFAELTAPTTAEAIDAVYEVWGKANAERS